jgi:asparagine synthase (glutamine-hydrolysing)
MRLLFLVNAAEFFVSHRLPLGVAAREAGFEVHVATAAGAAVEKIIAAGLTHHTFLVSHLARRHVTVALSGDGGDELFYGYERYFKATKIWVLLSRLPLPVRRLASGLLVHAPGNALEKTLGVLPKRLRVNHLADRLPKLAEVLVCENGESFYRRLVSQWKEPERVVLGARKPETILSAPDRLPPLPGLRERMMLLDMLTYLPDDILTKVDRASMAVSL